MNRLRALLGTAASVAATTLAACASPDAPTAPPTVAALTARSSPPRGVPTNGDTVVTTFTVDPTIKAAYGIAGQHKVKFPAYSICDPALSTYGPTEWDQPCTPLTTPITITALSYRDSAGNAYVNFSPALRFRKTQGGPPKLYLLDKRAEASQLAILYCPDGGGPCVDESLTDPDLVTQYDKTKGFLYRYIKHFSGYGVGIGRSEEQ